MPWQLDSLINQEPSQDCKGYLDMIVSKLLHLKIVSQLRSHLSWSKTTDIYCDFAAYVSNINRQFDWLWPWDSLIV